MFGIPMKTSGLPRIFNPSPVVIPGIPEQVIPATPDELYPDSYIMKMEVSPPDSVDGHQSLTVTFRPYNYDTHKIYPNTDKDMSILINNIWTESMRSPVFAQIMGGIIVVASAELQMFVLNHLISITTNPVELAALKAELVAVKEAMGINVEPYNLENMKIPKFDFKNTGKKGVIFRNGSWETVK